MLRTYKPIAHPIFTLHTQLEHLVCQVWCNASEYNTCEELLDVNFEMIYNTYGWLRTKIDEIYEKCKLLTVEQRADIREAFVVNNSIKELCDGEIIPIYLDTLPAVVADDMKPLLVDFYNTVIDYVTVPGNKLDYYNLLQEHNQFKNCPCCGLSPIESAESHYREDNDHYLPKADFPFGSVNFNNLVPLCGKCNKKCKTTKNPFEAGRISFYPFDSNHNTVNIEVNIIESDTLDYRKLSDDDIEIGFDNNINKTETWDWLFRIKERYTEEVKDFSKTELRIIASRLLKNNKRKTGLSYEEILNDLIDEYEIDGFGDRKFLKRPFLESIKSKPEWMAVYK
ncbi:MAG: hypothetical protein A3K10_06235 [Bacteroidetes bacterium RIFCSPLOWO2_12_FULL_31_6]|nr:MAG: hypothetical protein A3K10_06235 [Bacteroidetes bacterium RIFCSPLOWO2_12_FULL_31_6]